MLLLSASLWAGEETLSCEVLSDGVAKIRCTYTTVGREEDRNITFEWHSEVYPQDDRSRSVVLEAGHVSVYDYRFMWGRAQGLWTVTVTNSDAKGEVTTVSHRFLVEGDAISAEAR